VLKVNDWAYAPGAQAKTRPLTIAAHNEALFITAKLNMFGRKKQFTSGKFWLAPGFGLALGWLCDGFEVALYPGVYA
jgi:hypothetical protein